MIILGLFDKLNNSYDKFFMIRKDEFNNFMKSLKIIVNNGTDVLSVYSNDYYIVELIHLSDTGITINKDPIPIELSSLKEPK